MKKLIIVNLVFAGLFVICFWIFAFFTNGVFVSPMALVMGMAGILGCFVLPPMLLCFLGLLVFDLYGVFKYWSRYKLTTLLPFLILGVSIMSLRVWDVGAMSIKRFEKYLPDYEAFIAKVQKEHKPGDLSGIDIPNNYKHLGHVAHIDFSDANNLYVMIGVGSSGAFGNHTFFLYSSSGEIIPGSRTDQIMHYKEQVNEHWFRVSD
jgi:hypothetical protein